MIRPLVLFLLLGGACAAPDVDDDAGNDDQAAGALAVELDDGPACVAGGCLVDFGGVALADVATRVVGLVNDGDGDLAIDAVSVEGDGFSVDEAGPVVIAAGGRADVVVTFSAAVAGRAAGVLHVDDLDVVLRANVVALPCVIDVDVRVAFVNGEAVTGVPAVEIGDDVELSVGAVDCFADGVIVGTETRELAAPAGDVAPLTGAATSTPSFRPASAGSYRFGVVATDDRGVASAEAVLVVDVGVPGLGITVLSSFVGGAAPQIHVRRDGDDWCSAGDCYQDACGVPFTGGVTSDPSQTFHGELADGDYLIGVGNPAEAVSAFVRVFSEGQLKGEWVTTLPADTLYVPARLEVRGGAVTVFSRELPESEEPVTGDCW
jgi:hypothetical protein